MIKIVKAPLQLEPFLDKFRDLFTKPSYRSFRDLCGALSVCDKSKTVANLCDTMAECSKGKKARSSYNWFFSDANWDENEIAQRKVDLFIDSLCLKENDKLLLIIVANDLYILHVTDFLEYHLFYPFFISARSLIISTYCRTKDLLISSSEAIFSAGIPSP